MESKKCEYCGFNNPVIARFCRTCGSFFTDSSECVESVDLSILNKQKEEIIQLRGVLSTLSNDNSSLTTRYNKIHDKNELLKTELDDKKSEINKLKNEKTDLRKKINENETQINALNETKRNLHFFYLFVLIVLLFFIFITYPTASNNLNNASSETSDILPAIADVKPIIGKSIEVRNSGQDYNSTIFSGETTYINPKIEIVSLIEGDIELYIKFITPYGLSTGDSRIKVPEGFSYADSISVQKNRILTFELSGWGNEDKGNWSSGNYRIEIYYKDELIGIKDFKIIDNYVETYE